MRRSKRALILTALVLAPAAAYSREVAIELHCGADGELTDATIDGTAIDVPEGQAGYAAIRSALGKGKPDIRLFGTLDAPSRCIDGLIFDLRRDDIGKINFAAEPPPQDLGDDER